MKTTKKLFALILALMMVVSIAMPVMAADGNGHTITIENVPASYSYEAYQIFAGNVAMIDTDGNKDADKPSLTEVEWGKHVNANKAVTFTGVTGTMNLLEALQSPVVNPASYHLYKDLSFTDVTSDACAAAIAEALSKNSTESNGLVFADIVANYFNEELPTESKAANGNHVISGLADGYYLVKDVTENLPENTVRSLFLLRLVEDARATPKISTVSIDKKLTESGTPSDYSDKNIGDEVEFEIRATLPGRFEEYDSFYLALEDTMTEGLELIEGTITVSTVNNAAIKPLDKNLYNLTAEPHYIKVEFEDLKDLVANNEYTVTSNTIIMLKYKAVVTEDAVLGYTAPSETEAEKANSNTVTLVFSNDPHSDSKGEIEDKVYVYTFGLDVTKKDGTTHSVLSGAEFVLYRARQGGYQYAIYDGNGVVTGWTATVPKDKVIEYRQASDANKQTALEALLGYMNTGREEEDFITMQDITVTSEDDGKIFIKGLDTDYYFLLETKAPEGYTLDSTPKEFNVSAEYENGILKNLILRPNGAEESYFNTANGTVSMDFINNPGNTLPETGGIGTTLFYVFGGVMAVGALILLITKKRMAA